MFEQNCNKMMINYQYERFKRFLIKTQDNGLGNLFSDLDATKYVKEIKSECKVALLLIENFASVASVDMKIYSISIKSEIIKIDFLMKNLIEKSEHLICKSLSCFYKMMEDITLIEKGNSIKLYLAGSTEFLDKIVKNLNSDNS